MFGLTIEKLFVVTLLATVIIGPRRLPVYAARLAGVARRVAVLAGEAARRAEQESGVSALREDWQALDPRRYDPRRIIRDAWAAGDAPAGEASAGAAPAGAAPAGAAPAGDSSAGDASADDRSAGDVSAGGRWVTTGSSGHPRRTWVPTGD